MSYIRLNITDTVSVDEVITKMLNVCTVNEGYKRSEYWKPCRKKEYSKKKLKKNLEKLIKNGLDWIICDIDNTLNIYSTNSNDAPSLVAENEPGWFATRELQKNVKYALDYCKKRGVKVGIISASDTGQKRLDKIAFIKKHNLPIDEENIFFVPHGESKAEYLISQGLDISRCLLIDDYWFNIQDWYDHGGVAVKKTFSGKRREIPQIRDWMELILLIDIIKDASVC